MDIIEVINKNGQIKNMEVVSIFDISNSEYHYIIYKSDLNEYFVGKYIGENVVDLITDFNEEESKIVENIFNRLVGE